MIQLIPITGIGEITAKTDFVEEILRSPQGQTLQKGDILVVSSKAVAKWEGNVRKEKDIRPGEKAKKLSILLGKSAPYCQAVLEETEEIIRLAKGVIICRTHHGFILANAGVDASNAGEEGELILLPQNPQKSAEVRLSKIGEKLDFSVPVVVSDTFGRPFRNGQMDMAVGVGGMIPAADYEGKRDRRGRVMKTTSIAVADELCSAANLAAEKTAGIPAVIIRGYSYLPGEGKIQDTFMEREKDLFACDEGRGEELLRKTIFSRRSVRRFTGEEISNEELRLILKAGANSPCAHHKRPWKLVALAKEEVKGQVVESMNQLLRQDMEQKGFSKQVIEQKAQKARQNLLSAGALILLFVKKPEKANPLEKKKDTEYFLALQSVTLAGGQMLLAAHQLGLGACWYAAPWFCGELLREYAGLSGQYEAVGMLAVGIPDEPRLKKEAEENEGPSDWIILS